MRTSSRMLTAVVFVYLGMTAVVANAQNAPSSATSSLQGTVVSTARATVVIRTDEGLYQLFMIDRDTIRPAVIPLRAPVTVAFTPTGDPSAPPIAASVRLTGPPPPQVAALTGEVPAAPPPDEPIPASVRQLERDIQRQTRRWRLGISGASALDPELFMFGVNTKLGPFFSENFWARPGLEFGFGELTTLIAMNFEGVYRLPVAQPTSRWNVYAGGGPALVFSKRSFEEDIESSRADFSDLDFDGGFTFLIGVATRQGLFLELKSTAYAIPTIRFEFGYNF